MRPAVRRAAVHAVLVLFASVAAVAGATPALAQAKAEKVIRIPVRTDGAKNLDPVKGSTQYDNQACAQVYETLLQWKYLKRPLELEPLLLTEMPRPTDNPDGTRTWKFTLKPGVKFHDDPCFPGGKGRELMTDDVFYSWKRLADPLYEYENWWLVENTIVGFDEFKAAQKAAVDAGKAFDYAAPVAGFRKLSDREFEVVLKEPIFRFMYVLTQFQTAIVPREAVEKYGATFSIHPVGTGPFKVAEGDWKQGISIIYRRNPNYHECVYRSELPLDAKAAARDRQLGFDTAAGRRLPLVDRVEVTFYVYDPPMWLDFESGKLDFTQVPPEYFEKAFVVRTRKLRPEYAARGVVDHADTLLDFIFRGFNMEDPVVGGYGEKPRKLRQALSLAYDLEFMNESFYNGTVTVYDGPIPPGLDGYPADGVAERSYRGPDIDEARRLLAEAGYPGGAGLPPLDYYTSRGGNQKEQTDREQQFLEAIGVKLNARLVDFSELIEAVNDKKAQFFSFAWGSDYPDAENNLALFYSRNKAPGANHYNYDRPEYDALYEKIRTMAPGPERTAIYERMRDMLIEDAPFIGSMGRIRYYVVNPWLRNFKPTEDFHNWYKYVDVDEAKR
ncbi:MAG: ABC transporter substrate-binding protein [Phycisphaerales bacterium]